MSKKDNNNVDRFQFVTMDELDNSLDDVISEIKSAYLKYINDVKEINEIILQSKLIKYTSSLYETFMECLRGISDDS